MMTYSKNNCTKCDGLGNIWIVKYEGEKEIPNFYYNNNPLKKGDTLDYRIYSDLQLRYTLNKAIRINPSIKNKYNELKSKLENNLIDKFQIMCEISELLPSEALEDELNNISEKLIKCNCVNNNQEKIDKNF